MTDDTLQTAQAMLDVINTEILEREEAAIDSLEVATEAPQAEATEEAGDEMKVNEGEIQQASAIVTAKTMVDRVGRWIEELSGMENETLLQLGDSIRDEMGQEQSKAFIEASAPAIQQALENLKTTRETLASSIRQLTGEEAQTGMLGAEPEEGGMDDMAAPADAEAPAEEPADDFATAEPAAGGMETAGREKRESINFESPIFFPFFDPSILRSIGHTFHASCNNRFTSSCTNTICSQHCCFKRTSTYFVDCCCWS